MLAGMYLSLIWLLKPFRRKGRAGGEDHIEWGQQCLSKWNENYSSLLITDLLLIAISE